MTETDGFPKATIEEIERDLLLEGIVRRYGYDFRQYAEASLERRIERAVESEDAPSISALQDVILRDPMAMQRFIATLSIHVTSMFRDPEFYASFRKQIVPLLNTYPFLRIWIAGCATGEEVYSLAILLEETGLLARSRIYATDISDEIIQYAKDGVIPLEKMQDYTRNYQLAGGTAEFSSYYTASHDKAMINRKLLENVTFSTHNLVTDSSFGEFHVIFCRNVMIYFNQHLQERVMHLFRDSLSSLGFLGLGSKESIFPMNFRDEYKEMAEGTRLFRART